MDSDQGPEFVPSHPTLALFQSAMDEVLDSTPGRGFHSRDPRWLSVLYQRVRARVRGKAPFIEHQRREDFRFPLPDRGPWSRYWGLNANHEMYSGDYGNFDHLLPAFEQPASYFSLANHHWRLIGLDSAYVTHSFTTPQMAWFAAQLAGGAKGRIFGWFWGHEHHLVEYADYRGMKCRCIGHGSLPYVPPDQLRRRPPVNIVRMETRKVG